MYKPPENTNRVKSIKSKFENIEKTNGNHEENSQSAHVKCDDFNSIRSDKMNLQRQLSDPSKRNIKRTPAFRLDKNSEKCAFQRSNALYKSQNFKEKSNECDNNSVSGQNRVPSSVKNNKPVLLKSKTSIDFNVIRNKFDISEQIQRNDLYTQPIPKSLRVKNFEKPVYSNLENLFSFHNASTLKLEKKSTPVSSDSSTDVSKNSSPNSALQKLDTLLELTKNNSLKKSEKIVLEKPPRRALNTDLTDTLKKALKRPLPTGPAPKKPPRTFIHSTNPNSLNISQLHVSNGDETIPIPNPNKDNEILKRNPKYMLNKLETALKNNKLRYKKSVKKTEASTTTSGEDSDNEYNIFRKNSLNMSKDLNSSLISSASSTSSSPNNRLVQALNPLSLNCLNNGNGGFMCLSSPYSKLNESRSEFFVEVKTKGDEPVYAEPWHFHKSDGLKVRNGPRARSASSDRKSSNNNRNSLYYMSSPVLCDGTNATSSSPRPANNNFEVNRILKMNKNNNNNNNNSSNTKNNMNITLRQQYCDSPSESLSSHASDTSAVSSPTEDAMVDIKKLINVFEPRYDEEINNVTITLTNHENNITSSYETEENSENSENRLDDLRYDLQKTINDSFDPKKSTDDKLDIETNNNERKMSADDSAVNKFRNYVRNVSVYAKTRSHRRKNTLFDCCLIVECNADIRRIKFKYPYNVEVPHKIEDLCFPDVTYGPLDKTINAQCYSLVITNDKGERTFGYCRRVVPEGSNNCLPIVYCILSKHKSPRFYKKLLVELESRHGISEFHRNNLLKALYFHKFPQPGETIAIKLSENITATSSSSHSLSSRSEENATVLPEKSELEDSLESNFVIVNDITEITESISTKPNDFNSETCDDDIILNLHHDPLFEISDLKDLHELPMEILQKIFASLLLERKVILISCLLSKLSSSVDALQAMIYPFTWPHSFIPVLPKSLWEFVEAPTPIICGILSVEVINKHEIEHGIVIDLDEKCILKEEGDEDSALSSCMLKAWRKSMAIAKNIPVDKEAHSYHLTEAYIHMFAVVLKNYRDYIVHGNFQKEAFIRSNKSKSVRRFLKWFTDTTMFLTFVDAVITNSQDFSLFDKKLALYGSENSGMILDKLLDWKISS